MTLDKEYLEYPKRGYGMDHDWYPWTMQPERPKVAWPGGARTALFTVLALEFFPLDQPAQPPLHAAGLWQSRRRLPGR